MRSEKYPIVISTWPFVEAVRAAWRAVESGFSAVDSVVEGCSACEELRCDGTGKCFFFFLLLKYYYDLFRHKCFVCVKLALTPFHFSCGFIMYVLDFMPGKTVDWLYFMTCLVWYS